MIINLTPHEIRVYPLGYTLMDDAVVLPPSGQVARVTMTPVLADVIGPIDLVRNTAGPVTGLPEPVDGVLYVVSALVRLATPHRKDIASPGELIRDTNGQPIGCRGLVVT